MCKIIEDYAKKEAEKAAEEAEQKGVEKGRIESIKALMESTEWSAEKAMTNLKIPTTDFPKYMAWL